MTSTRHWTTQFAEAHQGLADEITTIAKHDTAKRWRLLLVICYCMAHPELPMTKLWIEYGVGFDQLAFDPREVTPTET